MFHQKLNDFLCCVKCDVKLDSLLPKALPCGYSMCEKCESILLANKQEFKCIKCNQIHHILHSLPENKLARNMLEASETILDSKRYPLIKRLEELKNSLNNESLLVKNVSKIRAHCDHLRYEVDISAESCISQINQYRDEFLNEINEYEKNSIDSINKKRNNEQIIEYKNKIEETLKSVVSITEVDDKANESFLKIIENLEFKSKEIKNMINFDIDQNNLSFIDAKNAIKKSHIGSLDKFENNSKIIQLLLKSIGENQIEYTEAYCSIESVFVDINENGQISLLVKVSKRTNDRDSITQYYLKLYKRYYKYDKTQVKLKELPDENYTSMCLAYNFTIVGYGSKTVSRRKITHYSDCGISKYYLNPNAKNLIISLDNIPVKIQENDSKIFVITDTFAVYMLNNQLEILCNFGGTSHYSRLLYTELYAFEKEGKEIYIKNGFIFQHVENKLIILNEQNGKYLKTLNFEDQADFIQIFHNPTLIGVFNNTKKLLKIYDLNNKLCAEILIENIETVNDMKITDNGYFLIHDAKNLCIYTN